MDRLPVSSSTLASVGYDLDTATLEVEFQNGAVYQVFGVPEEVFQGLLAAPSKGSYYYHHIRKAGYPYDRMA
jgi:hypothetical protein